MALPTPPTKDTPITILGTGTWGLLTAVTLLRRGYTSLTLYNPFPLPSATSAGNDLNKIVEEDVNPPRDPANLTDAEYYSQKMHAIAAHAWRHDDLFKEFYHETGFIMSCCDTPVAWEDVQDYVHGWEESFEKLSTAEEFRATMPKGILTGEFPKWRGYFKRKGAGWVFARGVLEACERECKSKGVKFVNGDEGKVEELVFDEGTKKVKGFKTADGKTHEAEWVILSAGAGAGELVDWQGQLRPTAWTLAHIQMSEEEAKVYKNLPVLFNNERGFFMEPDAANRELKMCDEHPGYLNPVQGPDGKVMSVPFAKEQIPLEAAERARQFLRETMPHLADREFCYARICWDADTPDRRFLIDRHPEYHNLILAVGGSGNGFMKSPAAGQQIADCLEGTMDPRLQRVMRWRPETAVNRDIWHTQNRFGADGKVMDFTKVKGWTTIGGKASA